MDAMETKEGNMTDRDNYHSLLAPSSDGAPGRSQRRPHEKVAGVPRFGEWNESAPQSTEPIYKSIRADASTEKGAAVPRFGEWDENNPQSPENFEHIFNKVREERNAEVTRNASSTPNHSSYAPRYERSNEPKKCCFLWW